MKLIIFFISFISFLLNFNYNISAQVQYIKENLGPNINSSGQDAGPIISPDGKTLYFYRDKGNNANIYYSKKQSDSSWSITENIGSPLNNERDNEVLSISPDGNTIYLNGLYGSKATAREGISVSFLTKSGWTLPKPVEFKVEPKWLCLCYLTVSSDSKTMILSLGDGGSNSDLYVSFKLDDGKWSEPRLLPENINTDEREEAPCLSSDNKTLYFASRGFAGEGDMDIFKTTRLDESWLKWSEPVNMEPPINTPKWDSRFSIDAEGEYAYTFSCEDSCGKGDIFRVKLKEKLKPEPVILVKGKVMDAKSKTPLQATIRYEDLKTGDVIGTSKTNAQSGEYTMVLTKGKKYGFYASADGYIPISENMGLTEINTYEAIDRELYLFPIEKGESVRLNNIFFETDKYELKPESYAELNRLLQILKKNPSIQIEISGHTDNVGTVFYNLILSKNRAQAVFDYLLSAGIDKSRLASQGYGVTKPIADNETEEGRQLNRRVEIKFEEIVNK